MASASLSDERLQEICGDIREQLFRNGTKGLSGVARVFRQADFNGNKKLDKEEFEEALSFCSLFLKKDAISFLFRKFDRDGDGNINYDEFLLGIQLELNAVRRKVVERAFNSLDKDGSKVLDLADLAGVYDASKHPDVQEGKKSESEVMTEFLKGFERAKTKDGSVTLEEFSGYYQDLGASIPSDEYFVEMIKNVYKLHGDGAAGASKECELKTHIALLKQKVAQKTGTGKRMSLQLKSIFDFFDQDESGGLTKTEFNQALIRLGIPLMDAKLTTFFDFFAGDDGKISTTEFIDKLDFDD